jgi:heme exporter protein A
MGELVLVRGPNGSGKTTLLRSIAGFYEPARGVIRWDGKDTRKEGDEFRLFCNYIGHRAGMKSLLTVEENLAFYAAMYQTEELLPAALRYFSLGAYANMQFGMLSQGWQRKVALSRLILAEGLLWLLDEPWNSLDEEGGKLLTSLIKARLEQGGVVCIAAHEELPLKAKIEIRLGKENA